MNSLKKEKEILEVVKMAREYKIKDSISKQSEDGSMLNRKRGISEENDLNERNHLRSLLKKEVKSGLKGRSITDEIIANKKVTDNVNDSRLYNKTSGVENGFKDEEEYDLYETPLFSQKTSQRKFFSNAEDNTSIENILKNSKFEMKKDNK